ncbi:hypothetical protein A9G45_13260 [Gilliamella sp. HK2]|uniref:DUF2786 domain-containing protein n=1 Tax=unclassified Gilliamella TaxID=2685620 RepID=UPI00080DE0C0|nr:DUF2786 domain-containing protein [Gilliamella apicola]OCG27981.1 hypothetical protein A9G46_02830 [Gilliamella apicola]OCG31729.1 hypothetical protein A9G45_13260 [Gilliamella apicola]
MTNNNEKYIDKIKKLLALAKSTNPHEAAIAMQRALKLMKEHDINASDVELFSINESMAKRTPTDAEKQPSYVGILANVICSAFGVKGYFCYNNETNHMTVKFYGMRERPQLAAYTFDVLVRLIIKARKEFLNGQNKRVKKSTKMARADQFCIGWINGIYNVLSKFVIPDDENKILNKYEQEKLDLSEATLRNTKNCNGADDAKYKGYLAGKNIKLNHGLSGSGNSPSLIGVK